MTEGRSRRDFRAGSNRAGGFGKPNGRLPAPLSHRALHVTGGQAGCREAARLEALVA